MSNHFQLVKDAVDIVDVARRYGLSVDRHNKAHCPGHTDEHASLSFKGQRFKCFSCDEGGDAIDLVRFLTNAPTPLDALRDLNHTYHLGIDLDGPVPAKAIRLRELAMERKRRYELWEKNSFLILNAYFHFLRGCRTTHAPRSIDEIPDRLFVESCAKLDYIEYVLDEVFIGGDRETKMWFLVSHADMIRGIERRLIQEGIPYAGRNETGCRPATPFRPAVAVGNTGLHQAA